MKPADEIIYEWFDEHNARIPIKEAGVTAMVELITTFQREGYEKEQIKRYLGNVLALSTNPNGSKNYKSWVNCTKDNFMRALTRVFKDVKSSDASVEQDLSHMESVSTAGMDSVLPSEPAEVQYDEPQEKKSGGESALVGRLLSPELLNRDKLDVQYDPELSKILGFDDE